MIHLAFLRRFGLVALPLSLAAISVSAEAQTAAKPKISQQQAQSSGSATGQAVQVASSGDWNVFTANSGRSKVCYALSQPKDRQPTSLNRDPGYMFVSFRPAEKVNGELAMVVGFPTKEDVGGELTIGTTTFNLLSKGPNVWLKTASEEPAVIAAMQKGQSLQIKVLSGRGNKSTDRYSLTGFTGALARAKKECQ